MTSSAITQLDWVKMELSDMGQTYFNEYPMSNDQLNLKKSSLETALLFGEYSILGTLAQTRDGLVNTEYREKIWPLLLGLKDKKTEFPDDNDSAQNTPHKEEEQLQKDIERSFIFYPKDRTPEELNFLRDRLKRITVHVLRKYPTLHYYQGYHDVASVIVLVFSDDEMAIKMLEHLTLFHLRDHMLPFIQPTIDQLNVIPDLLNNIDPKFSRVLDSLEPSYAISSILSLFAHDINNFDNLCVVWDFFFSQCSSVFLIYTYAAILIRYKEDILTDLEEMCGASFSSDDTYIEDEEFLDSNRDILHVVLKNVVSTNLNVDAPNTSREIFIILELAVSYLGLYPPNKLSSIKNGISKYSVLKTTSEYAGNLTLDKIHSKIQQYNKERLIDTIVELQIEECIVKEKIRKEQLLQAKQSLLFERQSRQKKKKVKSSKSVMGNFSVIKKILSSPKSFTSLILRDKKLNVSTFVKLSVSIGLLSFMLSQYFIKEHGAADWNSAMAQTMASFSRSFNKNVISAIGIYVGDIKDIIFKFLP